MSVSPEDGGTDPNDPYATRIAETTATIELDDGRTLAYCEFGDPDGEPVFVFHGGIGSRGFGLLFEELASTAGVRIVAPDRPGYGRSDPQPERAVLDWPDDVARLADHLEMRRFGVLGVSGGGPFAAACAYALPDRVSAAALVSSMGPPEGPVSLGLAIIARIARWLPWIAAIPVKRQLERARTDPDAAMEARAEGKSQAEAAMWRGDAGRRLTAQRAEGGRQGHRHVVREIAIVGQSWGFDLSEIAVPVGVWHGELDDTVPARSTEYLADEIPTAQLTTHANVGHLSLAVDYADDILEFLMAHEAGSGN